MKSLSWLLAGVAGVSMTVQAAEERPMVDAVEVIGCERVHPDRIRFLLSTRVGQPLDYIALADDVRAIEVMGPFTDTRAEQVVDRDKGTVRILFHVRELPLVGAIRFANLTYFQRTSVDDKIQTKVGQYLNPLLLEDDRKAIERFYHDKGHAGTVAKVETPIHDGIATVTFTVDMGREVQVGAVTYEGLPDEVLPRTIDRALINAPGAPWQAEMAEIDQGAVANTLQDLGWLDARCEPADQHFFDYVRPDEDRRRHGPRIAPDGRFGDEAVLVFRVIPGELWHLGQVAFIGNTVASEEELRKAFGLPEGAVFRRNDISDAVSRAERLIRNQGYARCNIRVDRRPDPTTGTIFLSLHVFEGDLYTVDRVDINGNYRTRDAIVRRALRLHPGDLWNEDAFERSKINVGRTGLFKAAPPSPVRLERSFDEDRPGKVDLMVNVTEDSTGSFRVQIGFSTSAGVFGELGYQERNFDALKALTFSGWRGGGQSLDLTGSSGNDTTSFSVGWANPHLWDGPYSLNLGFTRSQSNRLDWRELRLVTTAGIGRNFLDNDLRIGVNYSYTDLTIDSIDDDANDDALVGEGRYFINTVTLRSTYDRLDNPRLPTRGVRLAASIGASGWPLSASDEYAEWTGKADLFIPLTRFALGGTMYFHLAEKWQQSFVFGDTREVPFYDRYYGGGPSPRHRGFESGKLSPRETNINGFEDVRTGGSIDSLATGELVIPVQGEDDKIKLVIFADWGNVFINGEYLSLANMRTAVGFGVRFPVALPVALDFAWLLDPEPGESANQIHFALGFSSF